jgi:transcriptional regulator with XRE-family HTH domain
VNRIKELKEGLGLKTVDFSKLLKCGHSRISMYESGERSPTIKYAHYIVKKFNDLGLNASFEDVFPSPHAANDENNTPDAA